jgi:hypothetical protein
MDSPVVMNKTSDVDIIFITMLKQLPSSRNSNMPTRKAARSSKSKSKVAPARMKISDAAVYFTALKYQTDIVSAKRMIQKLTSVEINEITQHANMLSMILRGPEERQVSGGGGCGWLGASTVDCFGWVNNGDIDDELYQKAKAMVDNGNDLKDLTEAEKDEIKKAGRAGKKRYEDGESILSTRIAPGAQFEFGA